MIPGNSSYQPPFFLFNAHLETIFPALFRKVVTPSHTQERIITSDDDFLDLTWYKQDSNKVVVIQHGLEGNSQRAYIKGMAKAFFDRGCDALTWDYRGCGPEMNRRPKFYHSGETEDLDAVVNHALSRGNYTEVYLVGFSLGGNVTLKYLGEKKRSSVIKKAVVFSVPLHLESACKKISQPSNRIYSNRFLKSLKRKLKEKARWVPELKIDGLSNVKNLLEFDDAFTAPLHGFVNAVDYYTRCSALYFLKGIQIPTLIVNTKNDPFLSNECFPSDLLLDHPHVKLETPERGGHVGFTLLNKNGLYWSEQRALEFCFDS